MRKIRIHGMLFDQKATQPFGLVGALLLSGVGHPAFVQAASPGSSSQAAHAVYEDTNAFFRQHAKEGKLWFSISFGMVDRAHKRLSLGSTRPCEPGFWINSRCTLIFEYITVSGKYYRVLALAPLGDGSTAHVPTDEEGAGFRVYTLEGELIGEYWAAGQKASQMASEDQAEIWQLGWLEGGRVGFAPAAKAAKHFLVKPRVEEVGFGTNCYLRWSWDGGKTWGSAKTWDGVKPMDGPDYPDDREAVAWNVPKAKVERASDPWVELVVCKGLKITKKRYRIQDLPKHEEASPVNDAGKKPSEVTPKPNQIPKG
jgi:hypothetical protein